MPDEIKVIIRPTIPADRNFILSTWLKGLYFGSPYFRQIPQEVYFKGQARLIENILLDSKTQITVACDQADTHWMAGFAAFNGPDLYWVYVRDGFRNRGIAKLLLPEPITTVKSLTKVGAQIAHKKGLIFNPYPY